MQLFLGADGCRRGWAVATVRSDGIFTELRICETFAELVNASADAVLVGVDIPIGLHGLEPGERECDKAARRLLGARGASVFPVPVREAVHAASYREACESNQRIAGRRLSKQTWMIAPKIAEADRALTASPDLAHRIREVHPELCFAALNGWKPLASRKRTPEGLAERRALLRRHSPNGDEAYEQALANHRRIDLAPDDVLDAMITAMTALLAWRCGMPTVPRSAPADAFGIPMAMLVPVPLPEPSAVAVQGVMAIAYVSDMGRALAFYAGRLGMRQGFQWPPEGDALDFVVLDAGGTKIGLSTYQVVRDLIPGRPIGPGPTQFEITLSVPDVDAVHASLVAAGVKTVVSPQNRPWGERMCFVEDPDGNLLHLYGPVKSST